MKKSIISAILLLTLVLMCGFFTGCNSDDKTSMTAATTTEATVTTTTPNNEEPEPESMKFSINGVSIKEYMIVYGEDDGYAAACFLRDEILKATGERVATAKISAAEDNDWSYAYEIVVGCNARPDTPKCTEYYSYKVCSDNEKRITVSGYDSYALNNAAKAIVDKLVSVGGNASLKELDLSYTLPDREEYIEDIDKLYMRWIGEWQPDPEMLDYEAKLDAFKNVSDRLLTCLHRADGYYYPENSIEGIISAYKMGTDCVELDIQVTKDGKLILLHDSGDYSLYRMTNADEFVGKTIDGITFPNSYNVLDWTYEQIQYLNLRDKWGYVNYGWDGPRHPVTPYKVATLEEALKVCKNRMLIIPDKTDVWTYIPEGNGRPDLFSVMQAANNYESIIISYGADVYNASYIQSYINAGSLVNARPLILIRDDNADAFTYDVLDRKAEANSFGIQVGGNFYLPAPSVIESDTFSDWSKKIVLWGWTIEGNEKRIIWETMYNAGYRMIMGNMTMDFIKYAAEVSGFN